MQDTRGKKFYVSQLFPPWDKALKDNRIQLNPRTAILKNEAKLRVQQLVGLTAIICVLVGLTVVNNISRTPVSIQASFNFKRSIIGMITAVDTAHNAFTLKYESSGDQNIIDTKIKSWSVQLIPGKSVVRSTKNDRACFLIDDLNGNLESAIPADCSTVIISGRKILTDYVFLNIPNTMIVTRSIIGLRYMNK